MDIIDFCEHAVREPRQWCKDTINGVGEIFRSTDKFYRMVVAQVLSL